MLHTTPKVPFEPGLWLKLKWPSWDIVWMDFSSFSYTSLRNSDLPDSHLLTIDWSGVLLLEMLCWVDVLAAWRVMDLDWFDGWCRVRWWSVECWAADNQSGYFLVEKRESTRILLEELGFPWKALFLVVRTYSANATNESANINLSRTWDF